MAYGTTDLTRFLDAQNKVYLTADSEIKRGKKQTILLHTFLLMCKCKRFALCLLFKINFMNFVLCKQVFVNTVKNAVHKLATLLRAVFFCNINVFVNGDFRGDCFKI